MSIDDVRAAAGRLDGVARRTPVLTSRTLDGRVGASVFVKAECYQRTGTFKFRGAYNRLAALDPADRDRGVVAFSSGNHAQAVALAAALHNCRATIFMPEDAPLAKVDATRGYGAEVVTYDRYVDDREALASAFVSEQGSTLVPPYDDPHVIAGQGTVALELLEEVPDLDALVAPVGGGGLLAGCATAARALRPDIALVGVEPAEGDDTKRSLAAGERVSVPIPRTIADGQQISTPGRLTFPVLQSAGVQIALVSDDQIIETMAFLFDRMKVVSEPSGASALAALLAGSVPIEGGRVGVVLSGGNVGLSRFLDLLSAAPRG